jgi:glucose dehydrogenase
MNSSTGEVLWSADLGRLINAAPVSYSVSGRQYVAIAAGDSLFAFVADPAGG